MTVEMVRTADGKTANVHPDEVAHMRRYGWQVVEGEDVPPPSDAAVVEHDDRTVAKGPRGLWYVMKDGERISSGYASEADALASIEG